MSGKKQTQLAEHRKAKGVPLKMEVKGFGPIAGGRIELKPLTLFIGPNNSGKSYAAMLLHSIFESYVPTDLGRPMLFRRRRALFHGYAGYVDYRRVRREFPEFFEKVHKLGEKQTVDVPNELVGEIVKAISDEIFARRLGAEVVRSFASPLGELVALGKESFSLGIELDRCVADVVCRGGSLAVKRYPRLGRRVKLALVREPGPPMEVKREKGATLVEISLRGAEAPDKGLAAMIAVDFLTAACASILLGRVSAPCYYLPAARSGILQGHKALAAGIVRKAPYVGIERVEVPKFSGVVSDFISSVLMLPERKGHFYALARQFEKELICGEVVVRTPNEYAYPEIKYAFQRAEIPLHRASSTVSELAPLFLYLKYSVGPGDLLVIEEPEAHLHPQNQRLLAKYLVRLVRHGVNVTVTTHSEYLVEQLSSFLFMSKLDAKERAKRYRYDESDFLRHDEIGAYLFRYDKRARGHKIRPVRITEDEGISQEEFARVYEALYDESIKLRRDLAANLEE